MNQETTANLASEIRSDISAIGLKNLITERNRLQKQSEADGFWEDNIKASKIMQKIARLDEKITTWQTLEKDINELLEIQQMNDASLDSDIEKQYELIKQKFIKNHAELAYSGPYDEHSVLLNIFAGAGGVDAQDWAAMLMRMYLRWAENNGYKAAVLDESAGDEAGIKSASIELKGPLAYGKLKSEHGVHRLVRQSPYNADAKRQTSFAKVDVLPEIDEPSEVPIDETEIKVDVFRAGGHGGQSVNTTDSAVRVTHLPTNIVITIQNERSQIQNKETAMTILRSRLAQLQLEQHAEKISELKGPNEEAAWGNQIRNYVLHPYKQVKDLRTNHESKDPESVLDGNINEFMEAYSNFSIK